MAKATDQGASVQKEKRDSEEKEKKTITVLFLIFFLMITIPTLVGGIRQFFQERMYEMTDEDNSYARTDAVLKEKGAFYETQLVQGDYLVGVHIPEGKYTIELMEGDGRIQVSEDYTSAMNMLMQKNRNRKTTDMKNMGKRRDKHTTLLDKYLSSQ